MYYYDTTLFKSLDLGDKKLKVYCHPTDHNYWPHPKLFIALSKDNYFKSHIFPDVQHEGDGLLTEKK